jgi:tRNA A37 methylthiotransferase MiaB
MYTTRTIGPISVKALHVLLQTGSNQILHTHEKYLTIVDRILSRLPDVSNTADVIFCFCLEQTLETENKQPM